MSQKNNRQTDIKPQSGAAAKNPRRTGLTVVIALAVLATAAFAIKGGFGDAGGGTGGGSAALVRDADLVIPLSEVSTTARFYPVEIAGTLLEVIAVEAPDGTVRTAFNTCQVCYDSGRGYYEQDGDVLVCQNCGNRFRMDQVEVQSGGCNPVPIFPQNKTVSDENITISDEFLTEAKVIFSNWKA
ncbi:MAG: DUF2318 domain-containing protein [Clostridiales Family XIII bacterium]|jgi:hypothetical protein|nr:DUF2318 domain-containing protein [Clostridiales Family XIII bacterium]